MYQVFTRPHKVTDTSLLSILYQISNKTVRKILRYNNTWFVSTNLFQIINSFLQHCHTFLYKFFDLLYCAITNCNKNNKITLYFPFSFLRNICIKNLQCSSLTFCPSFPIPQKLNLLKDKKKIYENLWTNRLKNLGCYQFIRQVFSTRKATYHVISIDMYSYVLIKWQWKSHDFILLLYDWWVPLTKYQVKT